MTLYRKPAPYRKPQTYRGDETALPTVPPALFGSRGLPWSDARDQSARTVIEWQQATALGLLTSTPWARPTQLALAIDQRWRKARVHGDDLALPWGFALEHSTHDANPWQLAKPHETQVATPWTQIAQKLAVQVGLPWIVPNQHQVDASMRWGTLARHAASKSLLWRELIARGAHVALPWGAGHNYRSGYTDPWDNPPDPTTPLEFPDLPVYIMIPTISAVVIAGGADLKPLSVTISADVDSFDWSFEMQIPAATFPLVDPRTHSDDPVAIRVTVNGFAWSFIVDGASNNRNFKARNFTIRGGSQSRLLGNQFAPTRTLLQTDDYNAAQLADHEVDGTGWTVIWDAVDWLVPGGTFTYADLTPIAALQQLAASVGATLETDPDALNIHVRPRYPVKPWAWSTTSPYAIIPAAILDSAGSDWQDGNNADGIYVYPQNAESGAFIRITGSGGTNEAPMVVDPLLTDAGAQTDRGIQELAKAGRKQHEVATIFLFPSPALPSLMPLRSLQSVVDEAGDTWKAQVMGIQISATREGDATKVRQTLTLERQFRT